MALITQIQTPLDALTTRATTLEKGIWNTVLDLDFVAHADLTMATDTTYNITDSVAGTQSWTKFNSASDLVALEIVNGSGLELTSSGDLTWSSGTRTFPGIKIPMTSLMTNFTPRIALRIWIRYPAEDFAAAGTGALVWVGVSSGFAAGSTEFFGGRYLNGASANYLVAYHIKNNGAISGAGGETVVTHAATNRVVMIEIPDLLLHKMNSYYGSWSSGWPAQTAMTIRQAQNLTTTNPRSSDGTLGFTAANWSFMLFGGRGFGVGDVDTSAPMVLGAVRLDAMLL